MMPPGHVAFTWGITGLLKRDKFDTTQLDYRLLALSAMAPDLIDKPLALFVFTEAQSSQLIGHSLFPHLILLVFGLLAWRQALPYIVATNIHLIADRMWNHTESFWWPVFGWNTFWSFKPMNTPDAMFNIYVDIITRYPQVYVIEILALIYLIGFFIKFRLFRWENLKYFVLTGRLDFVKKDQNVIIPSPAN